jgi:hypothetical protein
VKAGLGAAAIEQAVSNAYSRGLKTATKDQIRCLNEANERQAAHLRERSWAKRSF